MLVSSNHTVRWALWWEAYGNQGKRDVALDYLAGVAPRLQAAKEDIVFHLER